MATIIKPRTSISGSIPNFRDFGGQEVASGRHVRRGLLFRSADLHRASHKDVEMLAGLGIRLIVDLRTEPERVAHPDHLPPGHGFEVLHLPILSEQKFDMGRQIRLMARTRPIPDLGALIVDLYGVMIRQYAHSFGELLQRLCDPASVPVLIHCQGGKDRTGLACALILSALGVPRDAIMADYLLTNQLLARTAKKLLRRIWVLSMFRLPPAAVRPIFTVSAHYLEAAFAAIEQQDGSVDSYLQERLGLTPARSDQLKGNLLDGDATT